ncbi:MAG: PDZ domain-containing protein [Phycisphaerae bacterium]|jgi:tricorn protease
MYLGAALARGDVRPHAGMLRNPDISATHIVFVYANDLWVAPREGGLAEPLASPPGVEAFPRFSPDGQTIAFMGNYDGNVDLYTLPLAGGIPKRVTYHPAPENLCDWTADGRLIFFYEAQAPLQRQMQLFTTAPTGGLPERLPVPYGTNGAISPDGQWLAYTPHTTDNRTWKRYRGGMATDIWLLNLTDHASLKITDWEGTDSQPMWHGDTIYYMSDEGPNHRLNIWSYELASETRRQHTHFAEYDVKWPAIGPGPDGAGEIVFQNGAALHVLDLATDTVRCLDIVIPGDRAELRPQRLDVSNDIRYWSVSPGGKRAVMQARGDVWTVPAQHGSPRNLTRTAGVHDRYPMWSPDGRWLAYFSDATGDYELYIVQSDGRTEPQQRTHHGPGYRYPIRWSPDSKQIAYTDTAGQLWLCPREGEEEPLLVDTDRWGIPPDVNWSHDSAWLAYTLTDDARVSSIWLYDVAAGERHQVTSGMFADGEPTFDRKGEYLFYASHRDIRSVAYADLDGTWIYLNTGVLCVVPLRADIDSPWAPKSDEVTWDEDEDDEKKEEDKEEEQDEGEPEPDEPADAPPEEPDADEATPPEPPAEEEQAAEPPADEEKAEEEEGKEEEEDEDEEKKEDKPLQIDVDGFEQRSIRLPVDRGYFHNLNVNDKGQLLYVRRPGPNAGGSSAIKLFDLEDEDRKEKTVLGDTGSYTMTADGKKLLVRKGRQWGVIGAKPGQKLDKTLSLAGMLAEIDPRTEWQEVFVEAWRILRDFFYVENMHGVDWPAVREQYAAMLADCASRDDVAYVIKEMISELNVGHTYYRGMDIDRGPRMSVGLLGVDFALDSGAYRIERIIAGAAWDVDARGPLSQPNVDVHEGDYLLAVNRVPLDTTCDPWAAFQGLAGRTVTLTVSAQPTLDDEAREVVVKLLGGESNLRYRAWVEKNRAYVAEKTGGRVGYIHVPDTSGWGQRELYRQFYGQRDTAALIIDERWNGGGQIPDRFIELLNRPLYNYWARRHGYPDRTPGYNQVGPKCMLINGLAGSGGDAFPAYFRFAGLGKLIGTRTWGGLVGMSGNPGMIDGTGVSVPTFGFYDLDGTWGIEGHGVDPDIEVVDDPALMVDGGDPQLDAAITHMLAELERAPFVPPSRPADPDRSGMGIREEDK